MFQLSYPKNSKIKKRRRKYDKNNKEKNNILKNKYDEDADFVEMISNAMNEEKT